jgi:hypothetical protein
VRCAVAGRGHLAVEPTYVVRRACRAVRGRQGAPDPEPRVLQRLQSLQRKPLKKNDRTVQCRKCVTHRRAERVRISCKYGAGFLIRPPKWGSGGRWFESSRPDIRRPVGTTSSGWPFSRLGDSFRPQGQSCGQSFDRSVLPDTLPRQLDSWLLPSSRNTAQQDPRHVGASSKHALWAISNVPRATSYRRATLNLRRSLRWIRPSLRR